MPEYYEPPFELTEEITNLTLEICTLCKKFIDASHLSKDPMLRKANRIKSIHSSLAIEHNSLSEEQVTALINGKAVIGPQNDINEVLNANTVYESMAKFKPYSTDDLLMCHALMMKGSIPDAGHFRARGVGVYKGSELIHMGSRPELVPSLVDQLFNRMKDSKIHILIKSCIFHYEFVYIHPFSDGNCRTARFWQTLILSKWEPLFSWLPIESLIYKRQEAYYKAISDSDNEGKSTIFITFMLNTIRDALLKNMQNADNSKVAKKRILEVLKKNPRTSARELSLKTGLSSRHVERLLSELKQEGKLKREGAKRNGSWVVVALK